MRYFFEVTLCFKFEKMIFNEFLKYTPKIAKEVTFASIAHEKMSPSNRLELLRNLDINKVKPKKAAVLMLFYPKEGNTHLVLIHRNSYYGVHSSQIAFPGGKPENVDINLEATALRETHEEIGIHPNKIEIIRSFTEVYIPPSNFMVYPFMGISNEELKFKRQEDEVAGIIELSLNDFLDENSIEIKTMETSYAGLIEVPGFTVNEHFVWGATAMMLSELKETLKSVF
jgi:8-oxo-dGTP pyrophosphatase MutT (NUDIX family)